MYGVLLQSSGELASAATLRRRKQLRASRRTLSAVLDDKVFEAGAVSQRRICRLNPVDAKAFGGTEDAIVELDAGNAAPLRAWLRVDASVPAGTVPMDARGLAILQIKPQDAVQVRRLLNRTN